MRPEWNAVIAKRLGLIKTFVSTQTMPSNIEEFEKFVEVVSQRTEDPDRKKEKFSALKIALKKSDETGVGRRFFSHTLPRIIEFALRLGEMLPLRGLDRNVKSCVRYTKEQACWLLSNMFLCTTYGLQQGSDDYIDMSFWDLHTTSATEPQEWAKLVCFLNYFDRVTQPDYRFIGSIHVLRTFIPNKQTVEEWTGSAKPMKQVQMLQGGIESAAGCKHIDFANSYIGGGVLTGGCVQEEIAFSVSPELCITIPLCPAMHAGESITIFGAETFSATKGYAFDLQYHENFVDSTARIADGTLMKALTAIDAVDLRFTDNTVQYTHDVTLRELRKAFAGFVNDPELSPVLFPRIATGNWGCGVFGGDIRLKGIIQWLAASEADMDMSYFPFSSWDFAEEFNVFANLVHSKHLNVGTVAKALFHCIDRQYSTNILNAMIEILSNNEN